MQRYEKQYYIEFPDSHYAKLINNIATDELSIIGTPEGVYNKWYKLYAEEALLF
jgi:hypothetical protein